MTRRDDQVRASQPLSVRLHDHHESCAASLSADARALAEQLADDDHLAIAFIPNAARAHELGMDPPLWLHWRAEILLGVGRSVEELRRAGWRLHVESRTGDDAPDGCERLVIVEAPDGPPER